MRYIIGILVAIVAVQISALSLYAHLYADAKQDVKRLQSNQRALMDTIATYKCIDGLNAYQIKRLEMTKAEFAETNNGLKAQLRNMEIKLKNLQSADKVGTKTEYVFKPDTIYIEKSDKPQYRYEDEWISFSMDSAGVDITTQDTIYVIRHQKVKRFLWWVRKRDSFVTIENRNPHAEITTIESIDIKQ